MNSPNGECSTSFTLHFSVYEPILNFLHSLLPLQVFIGFQTILHNNISLQLHYCAHHVMLLGCEKSDTS